MTNALRIVQLIDSLDAGGAERMAVHYANSLSARIDLSALVVTRKEGVLKNTVNSKVVYFYSAKKSNYDLLAFIRTLKFCKFNKITHIHAHSSSFFWAVLLKLATINTKVIWHDHFGNRVHAGISLNRLLIRFSHFFDLVITVNTDLYKWACINLSAKSIIQLPNFVVEAEKLEYVTILKGVENKRIVIVANLKEPKNHLFFLKVFHLSNISKDDWTLHFVGKNFNDAYSESLKAYILEHSVENVHLYGQCMDISFILNQSSIGVLASTFEGFPVTLVEYARANLSIFSTNVGECSMILGVQDLLFDPHDVFTCIKKLKTLTNKIEAKDKDLTAVKNAINAEICKRYSEEVILHNYLNAII